ncbi:MAG: glycosyltransferase family 4 protein, partial [Roseiflexaceae bacterium]
LQRYDGILALSHHEKGVVADLGVDANRINVVPNAVELDQYLSAPVRARAATPMILYIGQLVPRKGWDLAIRALQLIVTHKPDAQLVMVTHNTSQQQELVALAQSLGVSAHVQIRTNVDEASKIQLLQEAHVLLAPSRYEGFGIPPIEAMAAGCPVVTTDCAAGNEMVHHLDTGILVAYEDVAGYANGVLRLLDDAPLRHTLITNGLQHVTQQYTPAVVAHQTLACYQQYISTFTK